MITRININQMTGGPGSSGGTGGTGGTGTLPSPTTADQYLRGDWTWGGFATLTTYGIVSAVAQTFGGLKTFNDGVSTTTVGATTVNTTNLNLSGIAVSISGTSNTIAKFTATSSLGNSTITDDGTVVIVNTALSAYSTYVKVAGTAPYLTVAASTGAAWLYANSISAGQYAGLMLQKNSISRWGIYKGSGAEGGSDAGSDLSISRYSDAGAYLGDAVIITRSTGRVNLGGYTGGQNQVLTVTPGSTGSGTTYVAVSADSGNTVGLSLHQHNKMEYDIYILANATDLTFASSSVGALIKLTSAGIFGSNTASGNYSSGWQIDYGQSLNSQSTLYIDNIYVRGTLRVSIFQKDVMRVINGMVVISDVTTLAQPFTIPTVGNTGTAYVKDATLQSNDVVEIDEYIESGGSLSIIKSSFQVTSGGGTTTLTLKTLVSGSVGSTYQAGSTCARVGNTGGGQRSGYILLDSNTTAIPKIDIITGQTSQTVPANPVIRLGQLSGAHYGLQGWIGTNIAFNLQDDGAYIAGWTFSNTKLTKVVSGNLSLQLDSSNISMGFLDSGTPTAGNPKFLGLGKLYLADGSGWETTAGIDTGFQYLSRNITNDGYDLVMHISRDKKVIDGWNIGKIWYSSGANITKTYAAGHTAEVTDWSTIPSGIVYLNDGEDSIQFIFRAWAVLGGSGSQTAYGSVAVQLKVQDNDGSWAYVTTTQTTLDYNTDGSTSKESITPDSGANYAIYPVVNGIDQNPCGCSVFGQSGNAKYGYTNLSLRPGSLTLLGLTTRRLYQWTIRLYVKGVSGTTVNDTFNLQDLIVQTGRSNAAAVIRKGNVYSQSGSGFHDM